MPMADPIYLGGRRLRRNTPRDKAKDKRAFDAAVKVRRPLPIGARAAVGDLPSIGGLGGAGRADRRARDAEGEPAAAMRRDVP
jgi:hypothetical protein